MRLSESSVNWPFNVETINSNRFDVAINSIPYSEPFGNLTEYTQRKLIYTISRSVINNPKEYDEPLWDYMTLEWSTIQYKRLWKIRRDDDIYNGWEIHIDSYIIKVWNDEYFCKVMPDRNAYDEFLMLQKVYNSDLYKEIQGTRINWLEIAILQPLASLHNKSNNLSAIVYPYIANFETGLSMKNSNEDNPIKRNLGQIEEALNKLNWKIDYEWDVIGDLFLYNSCLVETGGNAILYLLDPSRKRKTIQ